MDLWFIFSFPVPKTFHATELQSSSNKDSQKTKCKCGRYLKKRTLEEYEKEIIYYADDDVNFMKIIN